MFVLDPRTVYGGGSMVKYALYFLIYIMTLRMFVGFERVGLNAIPSILMMTDEGVLFLSE